MDAKHQEVFNQVNAALQGLVAEYPDEKNNSTYQELQWSLGQFYWRIAVLDVEREDAAPVEV